MRDIVRELKAKATEDILGVKILNGDLLVKLVVDECIKICEKGKDTQTTSSGVAIMIRNHFGVPHENV